MKLTVILLDIRYTCGYVAALQAKKTDRRGGPTNATVRPENQVVISSKTHRPMPSLRLQEDVARSDGENTSGAIAELPVAANDSYDLPGPQSIVFYMCLFS